MSEPEKKKRRRRILILLGAVLGALFLAASLQHLTAPWTNGLRGLFPVSTRSSAVQVQEVQPGKFQLRINGRPYIVKGICYNPVPIGKGYDYDFIADPAKPWLVDGPMMKAMGANSIRLYRPGKSAEQTRHFIRDMYRKFGIRSAVGHYLGFWDYPPADYGNPAVRAGIKRDVLKMVKDYKDEPGVLFWILGNENNYSFDLDVNPWTTPDIENIPSHYQRRIEKAKIYYQFIEEIAGAVKQIDPNHPVVMGNGELASIDVARDICRSVDILGGIIYQGPTFGTYWRRLEQKLGKPNCFIEFGSDAYNALTDKEDQENQAVTIAYQWKEIVDNAPGGGGIGNSLGGFIFEWSDEWWKSHPMYEPGWNLHQTAGGWSNTAYYDRDGRMNMNEEWWGLVSQSSAVSNGVYKRTPRKAYHLLQKLWR